MLNCAKIDTGHYSNFRTGMFCIEIHMFRTSVSFENSCHQTLLLTTIVSLSSPSQQVAKRPQKVPLVDECAGKLSNRISSSMKAESEVDPRFCSDNHNRVLIRRGGWEG